jgi:energy-coupling factor transporter ATP-binding protein EcfA2
VTEIVTFYGTDGSGKSTIAREFSRLNEQDASIMLGGSDYKSWLTPEVAKLTLGEKHALAETPCNIKENLRLYEDIAIACYGFARILAKGGSEVVIDSDPFFKRIIWGTLGLDENSAKQYVLHFEDRLIEALGETEGPDVIVGVNMNDDNASRNDLLKRLSYRESNTSHDPTDIETLTALDNQVKVIWGEINLGVVGLSRLTSFNRRTFKSDIHSVQNPTCPPEQIASQAKMIALDLRSKI